MDDDVKSDMKLHDEANIFYSEKYNCIIIFTTCINI
jgi:hypothetical protein